jgi:prolipoprotein diacylglyceryltransferase
MLESSHVRGGPAQRPADTATVGWMTPRQQVARFAPFGGRRARGAARSGPIAARAAGRRRRPCLAPGTLRAVLDVIRLDFEPTVAPFGLTVRLETLALAGVIFVVLLLAALGAGRLRARAVRDPEHWPADSARLRRDDLILIAFGAVPGAIVGARADYGLIHYDYFGSDLSRLTDPGQGGLALTLAVVLGTVTALAVAGLLAAPLSRWLHVVSVPLLVGLGLGKLIMVLGADGQGQYSSSSWATAFGGPGPWQSANAGVAAIPSQVIEGVLVLAAAVLVVVVPPVLRLRLRGAGIAIRPGLAPRREWGPLFGYRRFLSVICLWAAARFAAGFTWRDATVEGPLRAEQLIVGVTFLGFLALAVVAWLLDWRRGRARARAAAAPAASEAPAAQAPEADPVPTAAPDERSEATPATAATEAVAATPAAAMPSEPAAGPAKTKRAPSPSPARKPVPEPKSDAAAGAGAVTPQ